MNKQIRLAKRPIGLPEADTWRLVENEIPSPKEGEALVQQYYISLDPAMRGWLNDVRSYIPPVSIDAVMRAGSVGKVIESKNPKYPVGTYLAGYGGVQQYAVVREREGWYPVDPKIAPLPIYISALGMPGMTAYFGLEDICKPKAGETILVSGAAGAVGSIVGQIAKIKGCRVIGIAGGKEKCKYIVDELGYDGAIDYKNEDIRKGIKRECPKRIDMYFDNVGGDILNEALARMAFKGRIAICGAISQYNNKVAVKGPSNYLSLLVNRASMTGFIVMDYQKDFMGAATEMAQWMAQGKLKSKEDIYDGIENFHDTFLRLFTGQKMGKLILKVGEE